MGAVEWPLGDASSAVGCGVIGGLQYDDHDRLVPLEGAAA